MTWMLDRSRHSRSRHSRSRCSESPPRHLGFTLLELLVVLILVAMIGGVTAMATAPQLRQVQLVSILDRIERGDQAERAATRLSPFAGDAKVDFPKREVRFAQSGRAIGLPDGWSVDRAVSSRQTQTSGDATVARFNREGQSSTYGIRIEHESSGLASWIVFLGISGQSIRIADDGFVKQLIGGQRTGGNGR